MLHAAFRFLGRLLASTVAGVLVMAFAAWVYFLRAGPQLQPWHLASLDAEFTAGRAGEIRTIADYRRLEDRLFAQLRDQVYARVAPGDRARFNRYARGSRSDPAVWPVNWNRTFEIAPPASVGGVLLLHGLTDSPYSLRSIGLELGARGYRVVGLRLPGHGTAPSGLLRFRIEDMEAATRLAMRDLRRQLGADKPIFIVGYSNGAALAVSYSLAILEGESLPRPAGLVLISPAIAVSPLAIVGRIRTGISDLPGFGRAAWQSVQAEVDPFKYQSFSFHAAGETHRLTRGIARRVETLAASGALRGFPPVLAVVSTVDSTVDAGAVEQVLLGRLTPGPHELLLFDVNRDAIVQELLVTDPGPLTERLLAMRHRPFALTVVTNVNPRTRMVKEMHAAAESDRQAERLLDMEWPPTVFSLSHVALPFPPDDPLYGYLPHEATNHVQLGQIEARGENGVLQVPGWMLTRQRSNPFHAYLLSRIDDFVAQRAAAR